MNKQLHRKHKLIITIDGPAASGKGTAAYKLAHELGLLNVDTGACFRAIAWLGLSQGMSIDEKHIPDLVTLLELHPLILLPNPQKTGPKCYVKVGEQDVTDLIRTPEIDLAASKVGSFGPVRQLVKQLIHRIAEESVHGIVVEGRDAGSTVFPDADIKFYLTATAESRAFRRHRDYVAAGKDVSYESVLAEILERDERDSSRADSPLRKPEDAIVIDSTNNEVEDTWNEMLPHIEAKLRNSRV